MDKNKQEQNNIKFNKMIGMPVKYTFELTTHYYLANTKEELIKLGKEGQKEGIFRDLDIEEYVKEVYVDFYKPVNTLNLIKLCVLYFGNLEIKQIRGRDYQSHHIKDDYCFWGSGSDIVDCLLEGFHSMAFCYADYINEKYNDFKQYVIDFKWE